MDNSDAALIGVIVALASVLGKVVDKVVDFVMKKKEERPHPPHSQDVHPDIAKLIDWHDVKDNDGAFVWYFPRHTLEKRFDEITKLLQDIRDRQSEYVGDIVEEIRKKG